MGLSEHVCLKMGLTTYLWRFYTIILNYRNEHIWDHEIVGWPICWLTTGFLGDFQHQAETPFFISIRVLLRKCKGFTCGMCMATTALSYIYIYTYCWWFQPPWKILVSWASIIPNIWKVIRFMFQTTNFKHHWWGRTWGRWNLVQSKHVTYSSHSPTIHQWVFFSAQDWPTAH